MKLTPFEEKTEEAIDECKGAVKHCAKNALYHLRKGWEIANIDLEMAVFRGITAEEEAASCLFYTLKNQKYKNSDKLQFKDHTYKQALYPHIISIRNNFAEIELNGNPFGENFYLEHFEYNNRKALRLHLKMPNMGMIATPIPPLHFSITSPDTGKVITFERNFKETYQGEQFVTALKYVKHIANERNQLLYASEKGSPRISGDITTYLEDQKRKVFTILHIMLLTDPWINKGHSMFVQQALDSFLLLLEKIKESEVCLPNNHGSS
jgi:hypothetical protein